MNRNQKIALGCGGAGCLGLIVLAIVVGVLLYLRGSSGLTTTNRNSNYNINLNSNSNSSADDNPASSSSDSSSTSMSEDDKHKLFHAASVTRDTEVMQRVWKKLGLADANGSPNDQYTEFTKAHIAWLFRNSDFLQEVNTEQNARAYVDAHIND